MYKPKPNVHFLELTVLLLALAGVQGARLEDWRSRTVYQVLTDRFAASDGWGRPCPNLQQYCGGTWRGMVSRLPYITALGFDAVWMSPVSLQGADSMGSAGYHGYWTADHYQTNPAFGSQQDLKQMMEAYHKQGLYVLFDMVVNHVGYGDYAGFNPFNTSDAFHGCTGCYGPYCEVYPTSLGGLFDSPEAAHAYTHCKLSGLPDLNHTNPAVLSAMKDVFSHTMATYTPDGLRLDAAGHSDTGFCAKLTHHVGEGTMTVGELLLMDNISLSIDYLASFLDQGGAASVFAFPMASALHNVFKDPVQDMMWLSAQRTKWVTVMGERVHDAMTFVDNHDLPRWLRTNGSVSRFKNALAYILFTEGIPNIYYGTEQGFTDSQTKHHADPRPPLWHSKYRQDHPLWLFLRISIAYRKAGAIWRAGMAQEHYVDAHTLVLSRGDFLLVLTSLNETQAAARSKAGAMMMLQGPLPPNFRGKTLRNIYNPQDKLDVSTGGVGLYTPDPVAAPQVFYLGTVAPPSSFRPIPPQQAEEAASKALFVAFLVAYALMFPITMYCCVNHATRGSVSHDASPSWTSCFRAQSPAGAAANISSTSSHSGIATSSEAGSTLQANSHATLLQARSSSTSLMNLGHAGSLNSSLGVSPAAFSRQPSTAKLVGPSLPKSCSELELANAGTSGISCGAAAMPRTPSGAACSSNSLSHVVPTAASPEHRGSNGDVSSHSSSDRALQLATPRAAPAPPPAPLAAKHLPPPAASSVSSTPSSHSGWFDTIAAAGGRCRGQHLISSTALTAATLSNPSSRSRGTRSQVMCCDEIQSASPFSSCNFSSSSSSIGVNNEREVDDIATIDAVLEIAADSAAGAAAVAENPNSAIGVPTKSVGVLQGMQHSLRSLSLGSSLLASKVASGGTRGNGSASRPAGFDATATPILHVALEYSLPHLGFTNQLMYGGMGLVVSTFMRHWPGPLALCAPLYSPCYDGNGGIAGCASDRPSFIPPGQAPLLALTVDVARGWQLPVEVFKLETQVPSGPSAGQPRTYYLVQSDMFRYRERAGMYSFEDESEMLTWLAVFNKAVAAVVMAEGYQNMQLHDYHGEQASGKAEAVIRCPELNVHMPEELRPAVLYVAHNAHYNACFPIPTPARKHQVYELLMLTPDAAKYVEHNGSLDILRAAIIHMRNKQQGHGVVAVSPRYASQVSKKLSCFWALSPIGRPRNIAGVLNSLDMSDSLAAAGLTLGQVLRIKAEAKVRLQEQYGLDQGQQYSLAAFVGRMTHQKGCDLIAKVAQGLMERHPTLQLVVVGPAGDPVGSAAAHRLHELSGTFPGRMFCPIDHYIAGAEKELLLQATDFCLLPSRFEPCGLVDVEFGWNGALIIGHDTGGLGKMPGVYFTAQASHLAHLARRFEAAVDEAMALPLPTRHQQAAAALAKRFPVPDMMQRYAVAWANVIRYCKEVQAAQQPEQQHLAHHATFFANRWSRCNKQQQVCSDNSSAQAAAQASAASLTATTDTGPANSCGICISTWCKDGASSMKQSCACTCTICKGTSNSDGAGGSAASIARVPTAQRLSNRLLVVLQPFSLGPGILLLTLLLLQEVLVSSRQRMGMHLQDLVFNLLPYHVSMLVPCVMAFLLLSTVAAPLWFWLAASIKPSGYIRTAAAVVTGSYCCAFVALQHTQLLSLAIGLTALTNLVCCPLLSMGMMGQEDVNVFEVGRSMLTLSDVVKYVLLTACMSLAAAATGVLPHQVLAGLMMLASGAVVLWLFTPQALTEAYDHMSLTYRGQSRFLRHMSCFWLSLAAGTCDSLALLLTGLLVISTTRDLGTLAAFQAIAFGGSAAAALWNWRALSSRTAELHLNEAMMLLAAMPFYQTAKAGVLLAQLPTGAMLGICAVLDLVFGGRSGVLGLAGFVTLPSGEIVSLWQFLGIMMGSLGGVVLLGGAYAGAAAGATSSSWLLFGLITGLEACRAAAVAVTGRCYPNENLSAL